LVKNLSNLNFPKSPGNLWGSKRAFSNLGSCSYNFGTEGEEFRGLY